MKYSKSLIPAYRSGVLTLQPGQTVDLGFNLVEGRADDESLPFYTNNFLLTVWVQVPEGNQNITVVSQSDVFKLGFKGQTVFFELNGQIALESHGPMSDGSHGPLAAKRWVHIAVVATNKLVMYVNGEIAAEREAGRTPHAGGSFSGCLGNLVVGDAYSTVSVLEIAAWGWVQVQGRNFTNFWTQEDVNKVRFNENTILPGLKFSWEFMECPPSNAGPAGPSLSWNGGAHQTIRTPGLRLDSNGSATGLIPSLESGRVDPWDRYTVQTWVNFEPSLADGNILSREVEGSGWVVGVSPSTGLYARFDGKQVRLAEALEGWHNVAVTGGIDQPLALYVDGKLVDSSSEVVDGYVPRTGQLPAQIRFGGSQGCPSFSGLIQGVVVWNRILSPEQIEFHLGPERELEPSPIAAFLFALGKAQELVAGEPVTLSGTASLDWNPQPFRPELSPMALRPQVRISKADTEDLSGYQPHATNPADPLHFSEEREQEHLTRAAALAKSPRFHPAQSKALLERSTKQIKDQFAAGRAGSTIPGMFFTQIHGEHAITFHHALDGTIRALAKAPAASIDRCTEWKINLTMTVIWGVLSVLDVPVTPSTVRKIISKLFKNNKLKKKLAMAFADTVSTSTYTATVEAFYDAGLLETLADEILDSLSWWDALWLCLELIVELVVLVIAPELEGLWIFTKLSNSVASVASVAKEKPSSCSWA